MSDEWYYKRGESAFGPVGGAMLHDLIRRGRLRDDTLVRRDGTEEWITVAQARPSLPPVPEAPPPSLRAADEPPPSTQGLPFDSSLPGASVLYAPPQAAVHASASSRPQPKVPLFMWVGMLLGTAGLLLNLGVWTLASVIHISRLGGPGSAPEWLGAVNRDNFINPWVMFTLALCLSGKFLGLVIWQGCAFASVRRLYGESMVRRGRASGLWYCVPIANLFMPFLCLRDLRYFSRKRRDFPDPHASFGMLLVAFEILTVGSLLVNMLMAMFSARSPAPGDGIPLPAVGGLLNSGCAIALGIVSLAIVIGNFRQQRALFAHWYDDAYWKGR